ncbi:MAG TPA: outer membrane beta-barrel protein [Burkholderiaceae bacterium]|nr:outer membrane beta-barrel protein [Burkholderiaceae bacterium]
MNTHTTLLATALAAALLGAASPAAAQASVTLFAGYAGTNGIDNATNSTNADVKDAATFGVALGMPFDASRELQLLFNQQSTTLTPGGGAAPFDLKIRHLHVGGTVFVDRPIGQGFYAVGGVGVTQFSPGTGGYGDEYKPSMNLGLGYYFPLGDRLALRAEARGYITFVNSSGGFLCSGGCVVVLKSDAVTQVEAKIGLMARF